VTYLRGYGIPHVILPGHPSSEGFNPLHNQAFTRTISTTKPSHVPTFLRQGNAHRPCCFPTSTIRRRLHCLLSPLRTLELYGMRDASHLKAQLMFLPPLTTNNPLLLLCDSALATDFTMIASSPTGVSTNSHVSRCHTKSKFSKLKFMFLFLRGNYAYGNVPLGGTTISHWHTARAAPSG
jgi:hypothetical protein